MIKNVSKIDSDNLRRQSRQGMGAQRTAAEVEMTMPEAVREWAMPISGVGPSKERGHQMQRLGGRRMPGLLKEHQGSQRDQSRVRGD